MTKPKVWILTREPNQYDQYGEYFVEVFAKKPTAAQLLALDVLEGDVSHVLKGGGRRMPEDEWWHLRSRELV